MPEAVVKSRGVLARRTDLVIGTGLENGTSLCSCEGCILGQDYRQRTRSDRCRRGSSIEVSHVVGGCSAGDISSGTGDICGRHQNSRGNHALFRSEVAPPPGFTIARRWTLSFIARATRSHCDGLGVGRWKGDAKIVISAGEDEDATESPPSGIEGVLKCILLRRGGRAASP